MIGHIQVISVDVGVYYLREDNGDIRIITSDLDVLDYEIN